MSTETATTLDQFVALKTRKADLEHELRQVKDELGPLEQQLLDEFATEGVAGKRHAASGKLVSISRRLWARAAGGDKAAACAALRGAGLEDFVAESFNTQTLSAYFREELKKRTDEGQHPALDDLLPPGLKGSIEITEDHTLSVRA